MRGEDGGRDLSKTEAFAQCRDRIRGVRAAARKSETVARPINDWIVAAQPIET